MLDFSLKATKSDIKRNTFWNTWIGLTSLKKNFLLYLVQLYKLPAWSNKASKQTPKIQIIIHFYDNGKWD